MNIFVDSSFIVCLHNSKEYFYDIAREFSKKYSNEQLYINSIVKYETINLIYRKYGKEETKRINKLFKSNVFNVLTVSPDIEQVAFKYLLKNKNQSDPNLFDHIHFASMKANNIDSVLTFDKHFASSGFTILNKMK